MPPPAPTFLPSNRRGQRLDPTRHLQSRELWNRVRFHASASRYSHADDRDDSNRDDDGRRSNSGNSTSSVWCWCGTAFNSDNKQWAISLLRAILYEIQPFRIKPALIQFQLLRQEGGWKRCCATSTLLSQAKSLTTTFLEIIKVMHQYYNTRNMDVRSIVSFGVAHKIPLAKAILSLVALRLYYRAVLYLHDLLAAGPLVIIVTLFILLYTIGLGDNTGASSGIPSAYSVFNRGVQRILGTVDGEELARQFAGGMAAVRAAGGGAAGGMINHNRNGNDDVGGIWMMHHENERNRERERGGDDEQNDNLINERRRQRRLERRQQQQERLVNNEEHDVPRRLVDNSDEDDVDDGDENVNHERDGVATAKSDAAAVGGARKSGKKARRKKNVELRRELQLQRQAAAALGFGGGMDGDDGGGALLEEMLGFDDDNIQHFGE